MATKEQVEEFLRDLKQKIRIWGILYRDDRGKNAQTLADLELSPVCISFHLSEYSLNYPFKK